MISGLARKIAVSALLVSVSLVGGCKGEIAAPSTEASSAALWQKSPTLVSAQWNGDIATLTGRAEPGGRVVLSDGESRNHAATADEEGRFEIEVQVPPSGIYLRGRSQIGQDFVDGRGLIYLQSGPRPLAAVVMNGEASYSLMPQGGVEAVDSDGAVVVISGRSDRKQPPVITVDGARVSAVPDQTGRWAIMMNGGRAPMRITVNGQVYDYPGIRSAESNAALSADGWQITRNLGGKAVQSTWFPVDK